MTPRSCVVRPLAGAGPRTRHVAQLARFTPETGSWARNVNLERKAA